MKWISIGVVTNDMRVAELRHKSENGDLSWEGDGELISYARRTMHALQDDFRSMAELFGAPCPISAPRNSRYDLELSTTNPAIASHYYSQARQRFPNYDFVFLFY